MTKENQIIELIASIIDVNKEEITLSTEVGDFDSWDSLAQVAIMTSLEDQYDCSFDEDEMMDVETVADIIQLVETKQQ